MSDAAIGFDKAFSRFNAKVSVALDWKHNFLGAAYSTRLEQAIAMLREACDEMESEIIIDGAATKELAMTDQTTYPPTIISFSDAMRLLKLARDASNNSLDSWDACREIAKAFERPDTYTAANKEELPKGAAGTTIVNDGRPV